jgi:uncharacterized DUF497 family protein
LGGFAPRRLAPTHPASPLRGHDHPQWEQPSKDARQKAISARYLAIGTGDTELYIVAGILAAVVISVQDNREAYGEQRLQSLGLFYGLVVFMVWVDRPAAPHLISARKAKRYEERRYWQTVGH